MTLANPFGHAVRGWADVGATLDYVSSRFSDGEVTECGKSPVTTLPTL